MTAPILELDLSRGGVMTAPLSPADVAQRWSRPGKPFPRRRIYRWCEKGVFPHAFKVGNRWAIPEADVRLREGVSSETP